MTSQISSQRIQSNIIFELFYWMSIIMCALQKVNDVVLVIFFNVYDDV